MAIARNEPPGYTRIDVVGQDPIDVVEQDTRQERHIEIDQAISNLGFILAELDSLIIRISGQEKVCDEREEKKEAKYPSLADVLECSELRIRAFNEQAESRINEIKLMLF